MEPNETVMNSYYNQNQNQNQNQQQEHSSPPGQQQQETPLSSPPNGSLSVKKRGRPRKYNTPEEAAAARRAQLALPKKPKPVSAAAPVPAGISFSTPPPQTQQGTVGNAGNKVAHLATCGNVGQGFTPHIISVAAGEDVYQKIMLFMQQSKREICILSASGAISNPFLRQPATSGGNVTYEGRFDILSLCGSYVRTDLGGRTGGLSVCLSSTDGQIIGGGVGGPLRAAGPVEVIIGTFLIDINKDLLSAAKGMEQMV